MLFKGILLSFCTIGSAFALSLDAIVEHALLKNRDLKSLQSSIAIANEQIKVSKNWKNPVLSLGRNDIHMDDPSKRDAEAMQADFIGFSQVIPMGDKLQIQENIAKKKSNIAKLNLDNAKLELQTKIYEYAYRIKVLEKKYALLNKYQNNLQSLEQLLSALYENGTLSQSDIIGVKISHSKLNVEKQNLDNLINNLYLKLEEITYMKLDFIDVPLQLQKVDLSQDLDAHPKIALTKELEQTYQEQSRYELASKNSDIQVNVAYFSRDSKFEDYANISVNIPLSLYGTENSKAVQAKLKAQEVSDNLEDLEQLFHTQIRSLQNDMNSAFKSYHIIKQSIIPLKHQLQNSLETYNSFNQIKPQSTINNLNEIISYEIMMLDEMKKYFIAYSKSLYFTQGKNR